MIQTTYHTIFPTSILSHHIHSAYIQRLFLLTLHPLSTLFLAFSIRLYLLVSVLYTRYAINYLLLIFFIMLALCSDLNWFWAVSLLVGTAVVGFFFVVVGVFLLWFVLSLLQFIWKVLTLPRFQKEKTIRDCFYEVFGWQIY